MTIHLLLQILGAVFFALGFCNVPRANWLCGGLLMWFLISACNQ